MHALAPDRSHAALGRSIPRGRSAARTAAAKGHTESGGVAAFVPAVRTFVHQWRRRRRRRRPRREGAPCVARVHAAVVAKASARAPATLGARVILACSAASTVEAAVRAASGVQAPGPAFFAQVAKKGLHCPWRHNSVGTASVQRIATSRTLSHEVDRLEPIATCARLITGSAAVVTSRGTGIVITPT